MIPGRGVFWRDEGCFFRPAPIVSPVLFALQETVMLPVPWVATAALHSPAEIMEPVFEMPVVWPICSSAYLYICVQSRNSHDFRNGWNDAPLVGEGRREAGWDLARAVGWERIYCTVTADCRTCSI